MPAIEELKQLAHLLRVGADVARDIAANMPKDARDIFSLADQAVSIATSLDTIASKYKTH